MGSPVLRHRKAEPLNGLSGYQCPWNLSFKAFSSSSPKIFTRLLGSLLYRYEITKFKATCTSICIVNNDDLRVDFRLLFLTLEKIGGVVYSFLLLKASIFLLFLLRFFYLLYSQIKVRALERERKNISVNK